MNKNIPWLLIAILVIIILVQRSCSPAPPVSPPEVITKVEWKYDTVEKQVPVYIPKWKTKVEVKVDTIVDTLKIIEDYQTKYYYSDTLKDDTLSLVINDTLFQNKIMSREINYRLNYTSQIITKEIYPVKREFFVGGEVVGGLQGIYYLGPKLIYKDKQNKAYGFGIGVDGNLKPTFNIGLYWKL